ncbi:MAG: hypothetical protein E6G70_09095 [Alphaproteobacteria bacterium]|nr:MAG: hypothetical protein E6G70_09095 [Alphaproteobacteria bacterium]
MARTKCTNGGSAATSSRRSASTAPPRSPPAAICYRARCTWRDKTNVIAGLDPAIHPLQKSSYGRSMDARVTPAHDERKIELPRVIEMDRL